MPAQPRVHPIGLRPLAAFLALFGLLTLKEGGSVLLGDPVTLAGAGAFVPFVVWFNTGAGLAYVVAAIGLWRREWWAGAAALAIAAATMLVFAAFAAHIALGGAYEVRTVWAMALRSAVWIAAAALACRALGCAFRRAAV